MPIFLLSLGGSRWVGIKLLRGRAMTTQRAAYRHSHHRLGLARHSQVCHVPLGDRKMCVRLTGWAQNGEVCVSEKEKEKMCFYLFVGTKYPYNDRNRKPWAHLARPPEQKNPTPFILETWKSKSPKRFPYAVLHKIR